MSCIKTYSGIMFDPLRPDAELISVVDIAHALSMLCRANGKPSDGEQSRRPIMQRSAQTQRHSFPKIGRECLF